MCISQTQEILEPNSSLSLAKLGNDENGGDRRNDNTTRSNP